MTALTVPSFTKVYLSDTSLLWKLRCVLFARSIDTFCHLARNKQSHSKLSGLMAVLKALPVLTSSYLPRWLFLESLGAEPKPTEVASKPPYDRLGGPCKPVAQ